MVDEYSDVYLESDEDFCPGAAASPAEEAAKHHGKEDRSEQYEQTTGQHRDEGGEEGAGKCARQQVWEMIQMGRDQKVKEKVSRVRSANLHIDPEDYVRQQFQDYQEGLRLCSQPLQHHHAGGCRTAQVCT